MKNNVIDIIERFQTHHALQEERELKNLHASRMTRTKSDAITDSGWNVSFWIAVLSPLLGILVGFFALLLFYQ